MKPNELARVVCRPALLKDTDDMLELTKHIWEGNDYLPQVWADWLADERGHLVVAEYAGRVVGICMLEYDGPGEWYLAGLRVHPEMEGRGIASQLHMYILDHWQHLHERGVIRLATYRPKVKHLCERTGFRQLAEFTIFVAPGLPEPVDSFTPLPGDQVERALALVHLSPVSAWMAHMYGRGWAWSTPRPEYVQAAVDESRAWLWRDGLGVLVTGIEEGDDGPAPVIALVGCPEEYLTALLMDYRRLVAKQGYQEAGWVASLHPELQPYLAQAGFRRDWDVALSLYERVSA